MTQSGLRRDLWRAVFSMLAVVTLGSAPAAAQWGTTWVGVAETGGDDVTVLVGGASMAPEGLGLKPVVGLQALWLDTPGGSSWGVTPSAGLMMRAATGAIQGRVGYSYRSDADDGVLPVFDGGEGGFMTSAQADYWDGGAYGLQGIASYNWGSEYLWTRARATLRVMQLDMDGSISVGPEFVYQGQMGDEATPPGPYSATQLGGILLWNSGNSLIGGFGAGIKNLDSDFPTEDGDDSTWYVKLEFVLH